MNVRASLAPALWAASALLAVPGARALAMPAAGDSLRAPLCVAGEWPARAGGWRLRPRPLPEALQIIATRAGWRLSYSSAHVPPVLVSVWCDPFDGLAAVRAVLRGTGLRPLLRDGLLMVAPSSEAPDEGARVAALQQLPLQRVEGLRPTPALPFVGVSAGDGSGRVVLNADSLLAQGTLTLGDALRGQLPGLAGWDRGAGALRVASVRGRGADGGAGVKIFVDGVEAADPSAVLVGDLRSIAEVEWLPGATGAAAYGTDALDGVLAIRTRAVAPADDAPSATPLSMRTSAATAPLQRGSLWSVDGAATGRWQRGWGSSSAGEGPLAPPWRLATGVTTSVQGQEVPVGRARTTVASGAWSTSLHAPAWRGALTVRGATGRQIQVFAPASLPNAATAGRVAPPNEATLDEELVREAHAGVSVGWGSPRAAQALQAAVAYSDREAGAEARRRSLLDSVRVAWRGPVRRWTARYRGELPLWREGLAMTVLGDAARLVRTAPDSNGALNSLGDSSVTQSLVGGTAMLRGRLASATWSLGMRGEWNDAFGQARRWLWLPSLGMQWALPTVGHFASRVRFAHGRSARAPTPSMSAARSTSRFVQIANPLLEGERQQATELGITGAVGTAASVEVTAFRQRTDGFTQRIATGVIDSTGVERRRELQYRTIGTVDAHGLELSATLRTSWGRWHANSSVVHSRIASLDTGYVGVLSVGGRPLEAPQFTAALAWTMPIAGGALTAGGSIIGPWRSAIGGCVVEPDVGCLATTPITIPSSARWHVGYEGPTVAGWRWRVRAENLTNNQRVDGSALLIGPGRAISVELGRW